MGVDRPRIALLRGAYFGAFEAQNFEPLLNRFDIQAYVLPQNSFDLRSTRVPVNVCRFPDSIAGRSLINGFRTRVLGQKYPMPGVDSIVRGADVVHTFEAWYTYTQQAAISSRKHGVPMVVTHWDTRPVPPQERRRLIETYGAARKILAPSDRARESLLGMGISDEKIVRMGMGVNTDLFSPGARDLNILRALGFDASDVIFAFVGRLAPEKGLNNLLEAFAGLRKHRTGRACRLLLIGSGPEESRLRSTTERLKLKDSVSFVPAVAYGDIYRWHRLADVFVYPSFAIGTAEEQFGYSLVEAMSSGVPVIATTVGGMPDVVGDAGIMIAPDDSAALLSAMARLYEDPVLRQALGKAARNRAVERLSSATVSSTLGRLYTGLIEGTT